MDGQQVSSTPAPGTGTATSSLSNVKEDRCIVLDNVFDGTVDGAVERENLYYLRIRNHFHRNSAYCGAVNHMDVDRERGCVYMLFDTVRSANKGAEKWHQSSYEGRVITVSFSDTEEYKAKWGAEEV